MGNLCCCFDGPASTTPLPPPAANTTTVTRSTYAAPGAPQNYTYGAQPVEEVKPTAAGGPQPAQPHQVVLQDGRVAVLGSDGQYYPIAQNQQPTASVTTTQPPVVQNHVVETHTTTVVDSGAPQPSDAGLGTAMLAGTAGLLGGMMVGSAMEQPSTTVVVEQPPLVIEDSPTTVIEETVVIDDDDDW
ncbi:hypothetical protein Pmar_PMAR012379 [Perkinsus marinus ATCC 50983]|uniref:Uncharacterized protein n=1 Tax=Perkinsus marinus (strain ATCC 50983 / TXsc) TaxID=423536 RepID=C5K766_PERM5|nr:hypothetical protein Pmar_PMAR012379 [Perkinsus marinus ATCC 50983]EER19401.1 hypothetical protein Pmar_PMAR012379 [Perkinsus marinus ATCC 50983]|eukprot:XP_002787605.1 hypothetical protein Pmar_PMAR012379 [Perkinsus marinus ATCC 50983]